MARALVLTTAGLSAIAADIAGGDDTRIARVEFGTGTYTPAIGQTDLMTPFSPVKSFANPAGSVSGGNFQVSFVDDSDDMYSVSEIGFFDSNDVLIAVDAVTTGTLFTKADAPRQWTYVGQVTGLPAGATVTFAVTQSYITATTAVNGVGRIATQTEVDAESEDFAWVTPETLDGHLDGTQRVPTTAQVAAGTNSTRFIRPLQLATWWDNLSVAASKITGTLALARIPGLPANRTTSGTFAAARIPDATATQGGKVELSTSAEVRNAVGNNPGGSIEDNVVTLQGIFDLVKVYEDGNLPNAVPPDGTIELVYES